MTITIENTSLKNNPYSNYLNYESVLKRKKILRKFSVQARVITEFEKPNLLKRLNRIILINNSTGTSIGCLKN